MISRLIAVLVLFSIAGGTVWYIFGQKPSESAQNWREEIDRLLSQDPADLDRAEALNKMILERFPGSVQDLAKKAQINERRRTPEGFRLALAAYDQILSGGDPRFAGAAILKAALCRSLGRIWQAKTTLFSAIDYLPFEVLLGLGETALTEANGREAVHYFSSATQAASTKLEETRAKDGLANAYRLLRLLNSETGGPDKEDTAQQPKGTPKRAALHAALGKEERRNLEAVRDFLLSDVPEAREAQGRLLWLAGTIERLGALSQGEDSYREGVAQVQSKLESYQRLGAEIPTQHRILLGVLRLRAAAEEAGRLPLQEKAALKHEAERDFLAVLEKTPEEARGLLSSPPERPLPRVPSSADAGAKSEDAKTDPGTEYARRLFAVSSVYLGSSDFAKVLEDSSALGLAQRVTDARNSPDPHVARIFWALSGLANLKAGRAAEAEGFFAKTLGSLEPSQQKAAALEISGQILRFLPGEPLFFKYFDRFKADPENPLDLMGRRLALLAAARGQKPLETEAAERLAALLRIAGEHARTPADRFLHARLVYSAQGPEAAIALIREAIQRNAEDFGLRGLLAEWLLEKATGLSESDPKESVKTQGEALEEFVCLFIRAPANSQAVMQRIAQLATNLLAKGQAQEADRRFAGALKRMYPPASDQSIMLLSAGLRACFQEQYGTALDRANLVQETVLFEPFLSYLKGTCDLGLAHLLRRPAKPEGTGKTISVSQAQLTQAHEHVRSAREEFEKGGEFPASKLELLNIELLDLQPGTDVPEDLMKRIRVFSVAESVEHGGYFLLARALSHRFQVRYKDLSVKNSEVASLLADLQRALRNALQRNPYLPLLYLSLAETYVVIPRGEGDAGGSTRDVERQLFSPDYAKAVSILMAVPNPDEQVFDTIARYLEVSGKKKEAKQYLETLARARPSADTFSRLLTIYLQRDGVERIDPLAAEALLAERPPAENPNMEKEVGRERMTELSELRKAFQSIAEYEGLRYAFEGMRFADMNARVLGEEEPRKVLIDLFTRSLQAYDSRELPPPLVVLNNLAWYLSESPDEASREKALKVAKRGAERVRDPRQAPEVLDTYGWVLYRNKQMREAKAEFQRLIEISPRPTFRYHLALVLFELLEFDGALAEIGKALRAGADSFPEERAARELEAKILEARKKLLGE